MVLGWARRDICCGRDGEEEGEGRREEEDAVRRPSEDLRGTTPVSLIHQIGMQGGADDPANRYSHISTTMVTSIPR